MKPTPLKNKKIEGGDHQHDHTKFYYFEEEDVTSAAAWLKEQMKELYFDKDWTFKRFEEKIDEAFEDVTKDDKGR